MRNGVIKYKRWLIAVGTCLAAILAAAWSDAGEQNGVLHEPLVRESLASEPIRPIPKYKPSRAESDLILLGERLFHERRLSRSQSISCADCHNLNRGGADGLSSPKGPKDNTRVYNTPTIFNVSFNTRYYWSARFKSLDKQIDDALVELDTDWGFVIQTVTGTPEYAALFARAFPDGVTQDNIKKTLIAYEQSLVTPNARFDQYLRGDPQALTYNEKQGYRLFKQYGCIACHQGVNIGGNLVIYEDSKNQSGFFPIENIRINNNSISLSESESNALRVPSLRNVARTAPYFHDGSVATLELAVAKMARKYLGTPMSSADIKLIVQFLHALTGKYNGKSL
jgi:cytochrome c peroxidase